MQKLRSYIVAELWKNEDGSIGYQMKSELGEWDQTEALDLLYDVTDDMSAKAIGEKSLVAVRLHESGTVDTRWDREWDFSELPLYIAMRKNLRGALDTIVYGSPRKTGKWITFWWTMSWIVHKSADHFKSRTNAAPVPSGATTGQLNDTLSDPSEGARNSSAGRKSNVVPLRPLK